MKLFSGKKYMKLQALLMAVTISLLGMPLNVNAEIVDYEVYETVSGNILDNADDDNLEANYAEIVCDEVPDVETRNIELESDVTDHVENARAVTENSEADILTSNDSEVNQMTDELNCLHELNVNQDYVDNQVIINAESYLEALESAERYGESIGKSVEVLDYKLGLALLEIDESVPIVDCNNESVDLYEAVCNSADSVEAMLTVAIEYEDFLTPVHPNYLYELYAVNTDNETFSDPFLKYKMTDATVNSNYQWYHEMIGSKDVWRAIEREEIAGCDDCVVAILDSGIAMFDDYTSTHEDFYENGESLIVSPYCAVSKLDESDYADNVGHGTNVAGIIASAANSVGGRGIAKGVKIMPVKISDSAKGVSEFDILVGLKYVLDMKSKGMNITTLNMSLGGSAYDYEMYDVICELFDADITVCAAAGNSGTYEEFYPAGFDNVISVAAVNSDYEKSSFSTYNHSVDISAPGGDYSRSNPVNNVFLPEESLYEPSIDGKTSYSGMKGSSMAAPVVTAVAALVKANNPNFTPDMIKMQLKNTARNIDSSIGLGAGVVDAANALNLKTGVSSEIKIVSENAAYIDFTISPKGNTAPFEGTIYYTIDGTKPNPAEYEEGIHASTYRYDTLENRTVRVLKPIDGNKVTIKAVCLLYGKESEVTTYFYSFSDLVNSITLSAPNNQNELAKGKSLKLTANVEPSYAQNKAVTFKSSDTSIATVDKNGRVILRKLPANPEDYITITATSKDGSNVSAEYRIYGIQTAKSLKIKPLDSIEGIIKYNKNTVLLYANRKNAHGELYNNRFYLGADSKADNCVWTISPSNATIRASFTSSNTKVVTVDTQGVVTAVGAGTAVVTVKALDGSGVKDTIRVRCENEVYKIELSDKAGKNYVAATKTLTPKVVFNDGLSVPSDKSLYFDFTNEAKLNGAEYYATINHKTGAVKVKSNKYVDHVVTDMSIYARAMSNDVESEPYYFEMGPITQKLVANKSMMIDGYFPMKNHSSYYIDRLIDFEKSAPGILLDYYNVTSSNTKVVQVDDSEKIPRIIAVGPGVSKISVKALDGSGKKFSFKVVSVSGVTLSFSGNNVIYPSAKQKITVKINGNLTVKSKYIKYMVYDSGNKNTSSLISVDKSGNITMKKPVILDTKSSVYVEVAIMNKMNFYSTDAAYKAKGLLKVYPKKTTKVLARIKDDGVWYEDINCLQLSKDETARIYPYSLPKTADGKNMACQDGYTYKTTNSKVVSVSSTGMICGLKKGSCYVKIYAGDRSGKYMKLKVTVK